MRPLWIATLAVMLLSWGGATRDGRYQLSGASGPDIGGAVGKASLNNGAASLITLSPGQVVSSTGQGLPGVLLIATDLQGHTVGATYSGDDGVFELATPPDGPLFLTVYGVPESVPFEPGSPILVVLP